ncbi:hypothetical protein MMC25_005884 [Agyrium rufum]|nr:hypothetical protein [Agyrium rufum]
MGQSAGEMYALAIVLSVAAIIAVVLRFRARRLMKAQLLWDDYLIIPALFFTVLTGVLMIIGAKLGNLGQHTEIGPEGPVSTPRLVVFQKTLFANQLTQLLAVGPTKLSVLMFYRRIFNGRLFDGISISLIVVVVAWTIAFFFGNLFECTPISVNWTGSGMDGKCVNEIPLYLAQAYSDVVVDVMILSLPVPMIWKLQMPTARKVGICGIFLLGALTVCASIAKMVVQYFVGSDLANNPDLSYYLTPIVYWPMIECSLGVIAACLPTLRPIVRDVSVDHLLSTVKSRLTSGGSSKISTITSQQRGVQRYRMRADHESEKSDSSAIGFGARAMYISDASRKYDSAQRTEVEVMPNSEFDSGKYVPMGQIRVNQDFARGEENA